MGPSLQCSSSPWPIQSKISTCFAALVLGCVSVFFLEYVVFFASDGSDHWGPGEGRRPVLRWRAPIPGSRPQQSEGAGIARRGKPGLVASVQQQHQRRQRLAVVVPAHAGDLEKALASLATWPSTCHESTLVDTDLILYYAGGEEDDVAAALPSLAKTGGKCFATTRLILANLSEEVRLRYTMCIVLQTGTNQCTTTF